MLNNGKSYPQCKNNMNKWFKNSQLNLKNYQCSINKNYHKEAL